MMDISLMLLMLVIFWVGVFTYYTLFKGINLSALLIAPNFEDPVFLRHLKEEEKDWLKEDLSGISVKSYIDGKTGVSLVELGIAENRRASERDNDEAYPGDVWTCDGRPIIFFLAQLGGCFAAYPLIVMTLNSMVDTNTRYWYLASHYITLAIVTVAIGFWTGYSVRANTRVGVKRFGDQLRGFMQPGLQFYIPFVETLDEVPLMNLVWGPHGEKGPENVMHLNGTFGADNPEPGKFTTLLMGRWKLEVDMQITLRFRKAVKAAWNEALNRYRSSQEIGEQIAAAVNSVLVNKSREIPQADVLKELEKIGVDIKKAEEALNNPKSIDAVLTAFTNKAPEIAGTIMQVLQDLGTERLAGILPISIAMSIRPADEFMQLLQIGDEAKMERMRQQLIGEGVRLRSNELVNTIKDLAPEALNAFLVLSDQETRRVFAQAAEKGGSLEALIGAFLAEKSAGKTST